MTEYEELKLKKQIKSILDKNLWISHKSGLTYLAKDAPLDIVNDVFNLIAKQDDIDDLFQDNDDE